MDKNIRKTISEAFEELYQEMVNEAGYRSDAIKNQDVPAIIEKAKKTGAPVPQFNVSHVPSRENFRKIIDALAADYKETGNPNSKAAIQSSYIPEGWKLTTILGSYSREKDAEDAAMSAYEQVVLNDFDKIMATWKPGDNLGGKLMNAMKNRAINFFSGYGIEPEAGKGITGAKSLDAKISKDSETTYGQQLANTAMDVDVEKNAREKEASTMRQREVLDFFVNSLEEELKMDNPAVAEKVDIFKSIINGVSPDEIAEENPEYVDLSRSMEPNKQIVQKFKNFIVSAPFLAIQDYVNNTFGTDLDFSSIKTTSLFQTIAQNPEFDVDTPNMKDLRGMTGPMEAAKQIVVDKLDALGFKWNDWTTDAKKQAVISKLAAQGKHNEIADLMKATEKYDNVVDRERKAGNYERKASVVSNLDESFVDGLMERVLRRLRK